MKLEAPINPNYAAVVVRVNAINELANCDNVVGVPFFGLQAIVSKDVKVGDIGLFFPAETQLSEAYAHINNLHRHSDRNFDQSAKGYLEDNRRVKALKFRGHPSNALFMPLDSLVGWAADSGELADLKVGDTFDKIGEHEICRKYVVKEPKAPGDRTAGPTKNVFKRVDDRFLPEHMDTENYWRNADKIPGDEQIVVTQKLHGTSIRIANTLVKRKPSFLERIAARVGVKVQATEYDHVYGSRKVIKDPNNPNQNHFYGSDIWTDFGRKLDDLIPENFVVYGELIGWTPDGAPIQKDYTYDVPQGEAELYIYRVAVVTNGGMLVDLSWPQVKAFAKERGLKHVPELWSGRHDDFHVDRYVDRNFAWEGTKPHDALRNSALRIIPFNPVPLDKRFVDEGVVIRADGWAPYLLKAKSPIFLAHETKMLDAEVIDLESVGSEAVAA